MRYAGIDIGSRTIKFVVMQARKIVFSKVIENSFDVAGQCGRILSDPEAGFSKIVATGYGRHLFQKKFGGAVVSEITAHSKGARFFFEKCRLIIDLGGQDTKVIELREDGHISKFEMNDKCAAGTGRFIEVMAMASGCALEEFCDLASKTDDFERISSTCVVFAESEVISLKSRGVDISRISAGIHGSIVQRIMTMVRKLQIEPDVVFTGGGALNPGLISLLGKKTGLEIKVPETPQLAGAVGCAIIAGCE